LRFATTALASTLVLAENGSLAQTGGRATEGKPRLSASEFRVGAIVSNESASRRTDACSVSALSREAAGDGEMRVAT
jgi:hypothetical protein